MLQRAMLICTLAVGIGCAHWRPETRPVPEVVAEDPERIMITRRDHSTVILVEPTVTDSMLSGLRGTPRGKVDRDSTLVVPIADVALLSTWDPGSTTLAYGAAIAGAALFISGLAFLIAQGGGT